MHAVVRSYSGSGAKELFDLIKQREAEVEGVIRSVTGFVSWLCIGTDDGGVTDESIQVARAWIRENASDLATSPPAVSEGAVLIRVI